MKADRVEGTVLITKGQGVFRVPEVVIRLLHPLADPEKPFLKLPGHRGLVPPAPQVWRRRDLCRYIGRVPKDRHRRVVMHTFPRSTLFCDPRKNLHRDRQIAPFGGDRTFSERALL
ncbi:MAG TPA: hypothetical protein VKB81_11750 [Nitrospira sp.]|nr:hypothetical protein [Nitrospira sp.]